MGFFKRKDPADQAQSSRRAAVPSEVQAAELRGRARRRLAGAVALVLAAVIILPMVLDSQPEPVADNIPIRVPERNTPFQPQVSEPQVAAPETPAPADAAPAEPVPEPPAVASVQPPATATPPAAQPATPPATPPKPVTPPKPEAKPEPKPATPPKQDSRSDDGARALALLEGRAEPAPKPAAKPAATKGNFVLQIAAYTTSEDAQSRRSKLHQAGVTNAFVEQATINGKQQYRLRVGPFPSREAAQAAQARLRTLGYDNGFIAAQ
ncbi:sporulation protein [Achromobacter sp. HZ01]|jgi:DedD protein|uniref:Sporulation protein n=1 Tax=Achromobacter pulmonis TaxID=1389932 RepID=A0A2N8KNG3_9BURK|nr:MULTISPECIES: SPOR domain-containing protein [Achromobacter]MBO9331115.1 SPOR domain-containing protein [Achromobacter xylosoxidans]PND34989.1 sporulation protein [Achromobacter pulmonis]RAP65618.1 sporulation protein [Achromobacter sp. HZ01]